MKRRTQHHTTQLAIVGSGLAGVAASLFALDRGLSAAMVGSTGAIAYTTGYFDLLGVGAGRILDDPWQALEALRQDEPDHPLSRIAREDIRAAFERFTALVSEMGVAYTKPAERNLGALLPIGIAKPTLSVPKTMLSGIEARWRGARALIVDFDGMQGFCAKEFAANFKASWPDLKAVTLKFPDGDGVSPAFAEVMARMLEVPENRRRLAALVAAHLDGAQYVGLPAVLGVHAPDAVHAEMEALIGVPVFEIPTVPPAVPGIRLREMFEYALPARGLTLVAQQKVKRLDLAGGGVSLYLEDSFGGVEIAARAAVLATGRFLSGGLASDGGTIRETVLGLPVRQPDGRDGWYRRHYFDPRGHPVNRCGIDVDDRFRPLSASGTAASERLFAAGTVLAGQDWVRQRCGAGVAIATAYKAVEFASEYIVKEERGVSGRCNATAPSTGP